MLIASEFADTFGYRAGSALEVSHGGGRHGYAFLLLGVFAIAAIVLALRTGSKPATLAIVASGAVALLLFLLIDLPDAGKTGAFAGFIQTEADPRAGFWLELLGAIVLLVGGAALALLRRPATIPRRAEHQPTRTQGA